MQGQQRVEEVHLIQPCGERSMVKILEEVTFCSALGSTVLEKVSQAWHQDSQNCPTVQHLKVVSSSSLSHFTSPTATGSR
jgi:hypothetical protein